MNWRELLWPGLESVPRSIATPELRHQSLLLSRLLRVVLVLGGLSVTIQSLLVPGFLADLRVLGPALGLLLLALILNHRGHFRVAALTAIGVMLAGCFGMLLLEPQDVLVLAFLTIPLFLAHLFLSERLCQGVTAIILIVVLVVPWALGAPAIQAVVGSLYVAAMAGLFNTARRHRAAMEAERRAALAASERELRAILDHMQDTYYRTDTDGRIVRASVSATRLLGYATNEVLGLRMSDFYVDPDGRAKFLAALQAAGGVLENYEAELRHRDGSVLWVSTSVHFVRDDAGKILGVEGTVRNVTERRRAEQALRDSESRYRTIVETAQEGIWTIDVDSRTTFVNRKMAEMLGYTVESMQGRPLFDFMDAEGQAIAAHNVERRKQGIAEQHDFKFQHHDGRSVWAELNTSPLTDEHGRYAGALAMVTDITERKRAEQSLLDMARAVTVSSSEAFFPSLVEHLARVLEADFAFVGALAPDITDHIRTIAVQAREQRLDNFEYSLVATPCANVLSQGTCAYPRDVQQLFPDDHMLVEMGIQAYVGTPLSGADGKALGLIAVLFRQPITRESMVASTLEIFAARATSELQRLRAEAQMRKLSSAIEQTADSVMITDRNGVIEYVNPAFERNTGFVSGEALGQTPRLMRSGKQGQGFYQTLWQTILAGEVFSEVIINRRKDGTFYYEEKTITPLKDAQGRITHFISTGKDVTERMQTQEKLEFMAQHDALTELPNRALLLDRLKQSVARARWHRRLVAVLFVDLDRFKTINDTLGHEAGDQLLQRLGERFGRSVREGDTVARFGGDEFVILLDDVASDKDIGAVAQKVLDALKAPFEIERQYLYITASIGISLFPNDGDDSSTLLKHADIAMYRAKELGKNTYQFYSADMSARAFERLSLETSLRHALERNEFVLHYQPQFDVGTGRLFGIEALLRWQHPDFGLVAPADFIALLEETGLIVPAGEWVLEEAGRQMKAWHAAGFRNLRLAVNLSPRQMQASTLLATVQRVLKNGPGESGWLELEITEGLLVQQAPQLMETFDTLRALGVRLAVDDFGTGYSSLSYLRRLPIDTLKIDRSFVRDVPGDADDSAITTTIIAMAQSLRLEVIAEGVENAAQRDFLDAHGCRRMQGYLFARPQTAAELSRLLAGGGSASKPA